MVLTSAASNISPIIVTFLSSSFTASPIGSGWVLIFFPLICNAESDIISNGRFNPDISARRASCGFLSTGGAAEAEGANAVGSGRFGREARISSIILSCSPTSTLCSPVSSVFISKLNSSFISFESSLQKFAFISRS